jgi:predicted CoA-binding protein
MGYPTEQEMLDLYASIRTIAAVGASTDREKAGGEIPHYLHAQGYRVFPVTPKAGVLFDEPTRPTLTDIGEPVDVVDVFRPREEGPDIARQAAAIGAKVIWFQPGTESPAGVRAAKEAGLRVYWGMCMGSIHGQLGLGPGPWE